MRVFHSNAKPARSEPAFSVMELLVAVSIMVLIIVGLYGMFSQTQKALRGNITQVDVLESGRAALDMITRDIEQMGASFTARETNFHIAVAPTNPGLMLRDTDQLPLRTNVMQDVFFLQPETNAWRGVGYKVIDRYGRAPGAPVGEPVGTLYRFSTNAISLQFRAANGPLRTNLFVNAFTNERLTNANNRLSTNLHRVIDGVMHLRFVPYDSHGRVLSFDTTNGWDRYLVARYQQALVPGKPLRFPYSSVDEEEIMFNRVNLFLGGETGRETRAAFMSNALPAYVELELAVLDPGTWQTYKSIREAETPPATASLDFLQRNASKVHVFRHRIPIRTGGQ